MKTRELELNLSKKRHLLRFLFSVGELSRIFSSIWLLILIESSLLFGYIQSDVNNILVGVIVYPFIFFISLVLYKRYQEAKKILFDRYTQIKNLISQELYDGRKLTDWQNELEYISDFLEQQGLLKRTTTLLRE